MRLTARDTHFLDIAIRLGAQGNGRTWPNPSVGCVIVQDGRIVGRARTARGGRPHAEPQALAMAGAAARGATAYVSLEPCAHDGKTPPCVEALVAAGVARVVTALQDPDPRTAGAGHARLLAAGIDVVGGAAPETAREAHRGFLSRVSRGRPWLTLKLASSTDGRIATATGESRWITGPQARRVVHAMRLGADAVMVGGGTARADDPELTVRGFGNVDQPVRIVASRHLDLPRNGRLAQSAGQSESGPLWLCHATDAPIHRQAAWQDAGARLLTAPLGRGRQLEPSGLLAVLAGAGLGEVFCEGGGSFAASLLIAGVVDEIVTFSAGVVLGAEGTPSIGALGVDVLSEAPRFELHEVRAVGPDVLSRWRPRSAP